MTALPVSHYAKNLLMVAASKREERGVGLREVFAVPTTETALSLAEQLADRWRGKGYEEVSDPVEECLSCLYFPEWMQR